MSTTIEVNGQELKLLEQGNGKPVLFVHGSASDYRTWDCQVSVFAEHYHVYNYSRRYHYPNAREGEITDYTVSLHARDLKELLQKLNVGPVNVVASSYGAYIALETALDNPELVQTLVLGEPPVLPLLISDPDNPIQVLSLLLSDFSAGLSFMKFGLKIVKPAQKAFREKKMEEGVRIFVDGVIGEGAFESLPPEIKAGIMENAPALKAEWLGPGFSEFPKARAVKLQTPILFACGKHSPKFFYAITDRLHKLLPVSQKIIIPDASHDMHADNPKFYDEKVLEFLARHN